MFGIRIATFMEKCPFGVTVGGESYTPCQSGCGEYQRGDCKGIGSGTFTHGYDNIPPDLRKKIIELIESEGHKNVF